jgi:hypothetical protein
MSVPDAVCWDVGDEPSRTHLVTHARVPGVPWRVRLPAPMPSSWVGPFLLGGFLVWFLAFVTAISTGHHALLALALGAVPAWLLGRCVALFAVVHLRREAFSVLSVLHDETAGY